MACSLILALCVCGCAENSDDETDGPTSSTRWSVTAVDGEAVPEGSSIEIGMRRDGEVVVEEIGTLNSIPVLDKEKLKDPMSRLNYAGKEDTSRRITVDEKQIDVKRKTDNRKDRGS